MEVKHSLQNGLDTLVGFIPHLLGFLVLLLVGYVVAKVVQGVVRKVLQKAGVDRHLHESDARRHVDRFMPGASPTNGIARVVFWLVFVFFLFAAVGALEIPAVTTFMNQVLAYLPNVIAAILIFVAAALISGAAAAGIAKVMGDTPTGKVAATVLPSVIMVIALFMILEQLQIAPEIVRIAFAATMGALALGLALAFGLGGRSVAQRMLEEAYDRGRAQKEQVKSDLQTGRARAESAATDSSTTTATYPSTSTYTGTTDPGAGTTHPGTTI